MKHKQDLIWLFLFVLGLNYLKPSSCASNVKFLDTTISRQRRDASNCDADEFKCKSRGCIPVDKTCDGKKDCEDGSDEGDCASIQCNGPHTYQCDYGACISRLLTCDGKRDCVDGSDETRCSERARPHWGRYHGRHHGRYHGRYDESIDEGDCGGRFVKCNSGECIRQRFLCDGKEHCRDGSDEGDECSEMTCNSRSEFRCKYGACIKKKFVCDGIKDCKDNSDEAGCITAQEVEEHVHQQTEKPDCVNDLSKCKSGECISKDLFCDGKEDCTDGSDENNCEYTPCESKYLFRCSYGACISSSNVCNGKKDCKDNSDEEDCSACGKIKFTCKSGECIDDIYVCDGSADCMDKSDETEELCSELVCPSNTFRCAYGACVSRSAQCNGVKDCRDGSDEHSCLHLTKT